MQTMSSKEERLLERASELFDGRGHQISQQDFRLLASREAQKHMSQWALIGSALRKELHGSYDPDFAEKVMNKIASAERRSAELPSLLQNRSAFRSDVSPESNVGAYEHKAVGAYENRALQDTADQADLPAFTVSDKVRAEGIKAAEAGISQIRKFSLRKIGSFFVQIAVAASVAVVTVIGIQTWQASELSPVSPVSTSATNTTAIGGLSLAGYQNSNNMIVQADNNTAAPTGAHNTDNVSGQERELKRINLYVSGFVSEHNPHR